MRELTYERDSKKPIYISTTNFRALWLLAQSENEGMEGMMPHLKTTPDAIADQMIRQSIREQYPKIMEHQTQIDKLEKQVIASLSKKEKPN